MIRHKSWQSSAELRIKMTLNSISSRTETGRRRGVQKRTRVTRCQTLPPQLEAPLRIRAGEPPPEKGWGWEGEAEGRGRRVEPVASDWLTLSRSVSGLGSLQREML